MSLPVWTSISLVLDEQCVVPTYRENAIELLQRYRRDRQILLDFVLSGSLIKKVVMPPGAVTLDDVDLDQVSVDYVLNCAKKGALTCSYSYFKVSFSSNIFLCYHL